MRGFVRFNAGGAPPTKQAVNVKQKNTARANVAADVRSRTPSGCVRSSPASLPRLLVLLLLVTGLCGKAQTIETFSFTNLNRNIPDGNASGLSDVRTVTSAVVNASSVRIKLRVAGEFNGDLYGYVRQIHATGTNFCVLLNRSGRTASNPYGYDDEGLDVAFDDAAANGDIHNCQLVTNVPAGFPLTGVWKPDGRTNDPGSVLDSHVPATALSSFAGTEGTGEWTLFLADVDSGATNMLLGWEIELAGTAYPALTWNNPADIVYGTALGASQLNATFTFNSTNVPGTFTYTPAGGTVLNAGLAQTISVTFTPDNTNNFLAVSTNVAINVLRAPLTITANGTNKVYGAALPAFTASYSGFVNGDNASGLDTPVTLGTGATSASPAGAYTITASGAADANYTITHVNGTLTVNKALTVAGIASTPNPSIPDQEVIFTTTVASGSGLPTGTVVFKDGVVVLGTAGLSDGVAWLNTSALTLGDHTITVEYGGDTNFSGDTNALLHTVIPPTGLVPIPNQVAYVLLPLVLTNHPAISNQFSPPLTFGLAAGAAAGARINPTNGIFRWTPGREQARSVNVFNVWVQDSIAATATNTFTVMVDDFVELNLGRTVMRVGQTSSVPVTLVTSTGLTNLQAVVQMPADRLSPLSLIGWSPDVGSAMLQQQTDDAWQITFAAASGQSLQGTQELAQLSFQSLSNNSAFIPLPVSDIVSVQTNGLGVWRTLAGIGRAAVIERESLVEALPQTNGQPNVILYGLPDVSYELLFSPVLPAVSWQTVWLGTMPTNLWLAVPGLTNSGPTLFFRAREQ